MDKKKELKMLKTAKGQIDGIIKMLEEERYCTDVSNQILATVAILKGVNTSILSNHLTSCVEQNGADEASVKKIEEVVQIIKKLSK